MIALSTFGLGGSAGGNHRSEHANQAHSNHELAADIGICRLRGSRCQYLSAPLCDSKCAQSAPSTKSAPRFLTDRPHFPRHKLGGEWPNVFICAPRLSDRGSARLCRIEDAHGAA
jgi:hypothetical protein